MNSRKKLAPVLCLIFGMVLMTSAIQAQIGEAEKLYEAALYQLEAVGNFEEAITLFSRAAKEYPANKAIAAKSLLKLGLCYERSGSQKAEETYERIIKQFPDQAAQVAEARERLAALHQQKESDGQSVKLSLDDQNLTCLSLSPDGSKMAGIDYSIGQNIAVYGFSSKETKLVTHFRWAEGPDDGWTAGAIWSPDGKELAYWKGSWNADPGGMWTSTLDGTARLLYAKPGAMTAPCQWLPDASGIVTVVADSIGYTLGIVPASGGSFKALRSCELGGLNRHVLYPIASVSPDGRFIVFEEGEVGARDIRIISSDGENVTLLTNHPADDAQPLWSPEGEHVVFKSNRHGNWALWGVAVKGGTPVADPFLLLPGMDATDLLNWSPAGVAFARTIALSDVFRMPVDPSSGKPVGKAQQVQYAPTGSNINPAWSPDGKHLAFVSSRGGLTGPGYVVVIPTEGGKPREFRIPMTYTYWTYYFQDFRWTPDGKALAFTGQDSSEERSLYRLTLRTGNWETWSFGVDGGTWIEWTGDANAYLLAVWGGDRAGIMRRVLGTDEKQYIYGPAKDSGMVFRGLRCSRDYQWLAFQQNNSHVVAVEIATGKSRTITPKGYGLPAWSPDGRHLMTLKYRSDEKTKRKTWEMNVFGLEGGVPEKFDLGLFLPKADRTSGFDWSPDGKEVAFSVTSWIGETNLMRKVIPLNPRNSP